MKRLAALLLPVLLPVVLHAQPPQGGQTKPLAFTHVTVIDVTGAPSKPDMTVIVVGNHIAAVGKRVKIPAGARVIDASGKYLIPGLWDMHAHALTYHRSGYSFPLLIANGVTGIREMGSDLTVDEVNKARQDALSGRLLGPRFGALTYKILDGAGTQLINAIAVATPDEGRQLVRTYKQSGADFIKPYNSLSREVYLAILDEAKKQNIPLEGHIPFSMSAAEVSDLGQLVIEHNFGVLLSCSSNEEELRKQTQSRAVPWPQTEAIAAAAYDPQKAKNYSNDLPATALGHARRCLFKRCFRWRAAIVSRSLPGTSRGPRSTSGRPLTRGPSATRCLNTGRFGMRRSARSSEKCTAPVSAFSPGRILGRSLPSRGLACTMSSRSW